jgi:serine protease SohB
VLRARFGDKVRTPLVEAGRGLLGRRIPGVSRLEAALGGNGLGDDLMSSLEARAWWSRYGF